MRSYRPVRLTCFARTFATSTTKAARVPPFVLQQLSQNARGPNPFWKQPYFRYGSGAVLVGGSVYYVSHVETVELTGRRRVMTVTPEEEAEVSKASYQQIMQQYGDHILPDSDSRTKLVKRVVGPLIRASGMNDLKWEVHVILSEEPNAFVIPGGKIFVFSGLLPITQNDSGLAAVLGHEIGHQVARHIAEKMSFNPIIQVVQFGLSMTLSTLNLSPDLAYMLGNSITSLALDNPYSRVHETEADHIGLLLAAQACFDPEESVHVWERMSKAGAGGIPQFMSTHPSNENRIVKLREWMPQAKQRQSTSDCQETLGGYIGDFRDKQKHANW